MKFTFLLKPTDQQLKSPESRLNLSSGRCDGGQAAPELFILKKKILDVFVVCCDVCVVVVVVVE